MNIKQLKKDLKELKEGIGNPNIPDNIKEGMKETIAELEEKIADADKGKAPVTEAPATEPAEKTKGKRGRPRKIKPTEEEKPKEEAPAEPSEKPKGKRGRPKGKHKAKRIYFVSPKLKKARAEHIRKYSRKKGEKKRKPMEKEEAKKRITKYIYRRKQHKRHTKYISKPKYYTGVSTGTKGLLKLAAKLRADVSRIESAIKRLKTRKEKVKKQPSEKEIKMRVRREMYQQLKKRLKFNTGGNA